MDHAAFRIVYVDKRVSAALDGRYLHDITPGLMVEQELALPTDHADQQPNCFEQFSSEIAVVQRNLTHLLSSFHGVHICTTSTSCLTKLLELGSDNSNQPTLVLLEGAMAVEVGQVNDPLPDGVDQSTSNIPPSPSRSLPSAASWPSSAKQDSNLLRFITSQIASSQLSSSVLPLVFIQPPEDAVQMDRQQTPKKGKLLVPRDMLRCMDEGAADVFFSPLTLDSIRSIASHAYRIRKDKPQHQALLQEALKVRKRSWVGIDDRKPYAYLREEMYVAQTYAGTDLAYTKRFQQGLGPDDRHLLSRHFPAADPREDSILISAITSWNFSAHELSEDQLVHAAFLMLQHALNMAELERWRLPAADLKCFLLASRAAYNSFVHYHNFRHVIDVMQAVFYFLLRIGTLPPYVQEVEPSPEPPRPKSAIGSLLQPFDALTLLVSAIGHDVGHPGVNNAFLVALNAPLAQLYNDRSVLESFHCAAYSQILRRYWKSAFEDTAMRGLMISTILATDMGVHFKYMTDLGNLQEKLLHDGGTDSWSPQVLDDYRTLTCGLLIKCADISNVARPFSVAATWADILQLEFANQGVMEDDLGMATTLFGGPPELGNLAKLASSQTGFMNIFARPLFQAVSDILPGMAFAVEEMKTNQHIWKQKIQEQMPTKAKQNSVSSESFLSPRSVSPSRSFTQPELSHPEGLPASQVSSRVLRSSTIHESEEPRHASATPVSPSSDLLAQTHSQDSRRSSLGGHLGHSGSVIDPNSSSGRPSGTYLSGHGMPALPSTRRPSATSPGQLQLGVGTDSSLRPYPTSLAAENIQPGRRSSDGTQTNASTVTSEAGSQNIAILGGGGGTTRKGSKSSDGDQTFGQQRSVAYTMARHSPYSTHERHSSGGHTSRSQSVPYSPTETQATSVTEDSDDRSQRMHERGGSCTIIEGVPEILDAEQPGSGHRLTGSGFLSHSKGPDVKTAVVNGGQHSHADRLVTRKSSRFLNFWKKRGKVTEPGS
ncbi:MAG: hypothetical protein Q9211_002787 [Gyalolechia sp. 1 TL-2023]